MASEKTFYVHDISFKTFFELQTALDINEIEIQKVKCPSNVNFGICNGYH